MSEEFICKGDEVMIYLGTDVEKEAAITVAKLMAAAAKTAPKGCGEDNVEVLILQTLA